MSLSYLFDCDVPFVLFAPQREFSFFSHFFFCFDKRLVSFNCAASFASIQNEPMMNTSKHALRLKGVES